MKNNEERSQLLLLLNEFGTLLNYDVKAARLLANDYVNSGFGVADAVHIAFAQLANAAFVSVDDKLLRRCQRFGLNIWSGSPMAFCEKEGLE